MYYVHSLNLDNKRYKFKYIKFCDLHQILMQRTEEQQIQYSQYAVSSAFHAINFGAQDCGLLFVTPLDILHVVTK